MRANAKQCITMHNNSHVQRSAYLAGEREREGELGKKKTMQSNAEQCKPKQHNATPCKAFQSKMMQRSAMQRSATALQAL
eukprot:1113785-Pyramimonas_sp.AAC.1